MPLELIVTSAPRGVKSGRTGFQSVVRTRGMRDDVMGQLERQAGYRHVRSPGNAGNPIAFTFRSLATPQGSLRVLSRTIDAGTDYSRRSNKLAHIYAIDTEEFSRFLSSSPAAILQSSQNSFVNTWSGDPQERASQPTLPSPQVRAGICRQWQQTTSDAGWGGVLAARAIEGKPTVIVAPDCSPHSSLLLLKLFAEASGLLSPEQRWQASFETLTLGNSTSLWQGTYRDSPETSSLRPGSFVVDLSSRKGVPAELSQHPLVLVARSGPTTASAPRTIGTSKTVPAPSAPPTRNALPQGSSPPILTETAASKAIRRVQSDEFAPAARFNIPLAIGMGAGGVLLLLFVGVTIALSVVSGVIGNRSQPVPPPNLVAIQGGNQHAGQGPQKQGVALNDGNAQQQPANSGDKPGDTNKPQVNEGTNPQEQKPEAPTPAPSTQDEPSATPRNGDPIPPDRDALAGSGSHSPERKTPRQEVLLQDIEEYFDRLREFPSQPHSNEVIGLLLPREQGRGDATTTTLTNQANGKSAAFRNDFFQLDIPGFVVKPNENDLQRWDIIDVNGDNAEQKELGVIGTISVDQNSGGIIWSLATPADDSNPSLAFRRFILKTSPLIIRLTEEKRKEIIGARDPNKQQLPNCYWIPLSKPLEIQWADDLRPTCFSLLETGEASLAFANADALPPGSLTELTDNLDYDISFASAPLQVFLPDPDQDQPEGVNSPVRVELVWKPQIPNLAFTLHDHTFSCEEEFICTWSDSGISLSRNSGVLPKRFSENAFRWKEEGFSEGGYTAFNLEKLEEILTESSDPAQVISLQKYIEALLSVCLSEEKKDAPPLGKKEAEKLIKGALEWEKQRLVDSVEDSSKKTITVNSFPNDVKKWNVVEWKEVLARYLMEGKSSLDEKSRLAFEMAKEQLVPWMLYTRNWQRLNADQFQQHPLPALKVIIKRRFTPTQSANTEPIEYQALTIE